MMVCMDGMVSRELCSLRYVTIDEIVESILMEGRGAQMANIHAYRNILAHPDDRHLLAVQWEGHTYVDKALPCTQLLCTAHALQWICKKKVNFRFANKLDACCGALTFSFLYWSTSCLAYCLHDIQVSTIPAPSLGATVI